ncbi:MAG: RNA polymerase sigma factor [Bacteroidales bacterium]|nr:RNA polymerase sigma factor [Candidatus Latescibacterota bacterium]
MNLDWSQLDLARHGDETAWRSLVDRHSPRLLKMVVLITGSPAAAQDIIQQTFLDLYRKGPRHNHGSFQGYLSTVAYHQAIKEKRRVKKLQPFGAVDMPSCNWTPLDIALAEEKERIISDVIQSLEKSHRDILILRFYGEHSYKEIAGISGLPLGTVKSRIFNALKKCRILLREKGDLK